VKNSIMQKEMKQTKKMKKMLFPPYLMEFT